MSGLADMLLLLKDDPGVEAKATELNLMEYFNKISDIAQDLKAIEDNMLEPNAAIDPSSAELEAFAAIARRYVPETLLRGVD